MDDKGTNNTLNTLLIHLSPGEMVLFHGATIHRGEYTPGPSESYAVHFYCVNGDVDLDNADYDQTEFVDF